MIWYEEISYGYSIWPCYKLKSFNLKNYFRVMDRHSSLAFKGTDRNNLISVELMRGTFRVAELQHQGEIPSNTMVLDL